MSRQLKRSPRSYSCNDKYDIVGSILRGQTGTILDVGARDRSLRRFIEGPDLKYYSADMDGSHDFTIDLEEKLPFEDMSYDFVVALDVLEHVEHIHQAFHELARITRESMIISLPNMATLRKRWSFLCRGNLGTAKYDLGSESAADRHRWLTTYSEMEEFVTANTAIAGLAVKSTVEELDPGIVPGHIALLAARAGFLPGGFLTARCIYWMVHL